MKIILRYQTWVNPQIANSSVKDIASTQIELDKIQSAIDAAVVSIDTLKT